MDCSPLLAFSRLSFLSRGCARVLEHSQDVLASRRCRNSHLEPWRRLGPVWFSFEAFPFSIDLIKFKKKGKKEAGRIGLFFFPFFFFSDQMPGSVCYRANSYFEISFHFKAPHKNLELQTKMRRCQTSQTNPTPNLFINSKSIFCFVNFFEKNSFFFQIKTFLLRRTNKQT